MFEPLAGGRPPGDATVPLSAPAVPARLVGVGVVVPIRAFALGKRRLARHLAPGERAELARELAECVVAAAVGLPVLVVSSDDDVRGWAAGRPVAIIDDPGSLDGAAAAGRAWFAAAG